MLEIYTCLGYLAGQTERIKLVVMVNGVALRGVAGPIVDARLARDAAVRRALAQLEDRVCGIA
ncbi:MAG: hypothetical protein QOG75_5877 [Mycobacterium sp.]|nr:hypothetical protein [Mycobacterium sp.]